jgi:hypothetical protein
MRKRALVELSTDKKEEKKICCFFFAHDLTMNTNLLILPFSVGNFGIFFFKFLLTDCCVYNADKMFSLD